MKQAQYERSRRVISTKRPWGNSPEAYCYPAYAPNTPRTASLGIGRLAGSLIGGIFRALWWVVTLPFRLVFAVFSLLGRLAGLAVGFCLMVVGMALCFGPFFILGIPLFVIGLLLALRCVG